jgi:hypothetical protein
MDMTGSLGWNDSGPIWERGRAASGRPRAGRRAK